MHGVCDCDVRSVRSKTGEIDRYYNRLSNVILIDFFTVENGERLIVPRISYLHVYCCVIIVLELLHAHTCDIGEYDVSISYGLTID